MSEEKKAIAIIPDNTKIELFKKYISETEIDPVETQEQYDFSIDLIKEIIEKKKEAEDYKKSITQPMEKAKKKVIAMFKPILENYDNLITKLKNKAKPYLKQIDDDRIAKQKIADEKAQAEKDRLQKIVDDKEAEAKRLDNSGDKEESKKAKIEVGKTRLLQLEVKVEKQEKIDKKGSSLRDCWKAEIVDKVKFIEYCLSKDRLEFIEINISELNRFLQKEKGITKAEGIKIIKTQTMSVR